MEDVKYISFQALTNGTTADGTAHIVSNYNSLAVQIVIGGTGTVNFECTVDGSNWVNFVGSSISTAGSTAVSATASGAYQFNISGLNSVRMRVSANDGAITVTGRLSTAALGGGAGGSGGGGGAITVADAADVALGATSDAAVTTNTTGTVSGKLRGLVAILADVWSSAAHFLKTSLYTPNGDSAMDDTNDAVRVHVVADSLSGATATDDGEIAADTASCAVAIAPQYVKGIAHGTNPTDITVNNRVLAIANRAGLPFTIAGHPNLIVKTFTIADADGAQSDISMTGTIATGTKVVVTYCKAKVSPANTGNTTLRVGFGATNTPAAAAGGTTGLLIDGTYSASGVPGETLGTGASIVGIGADGEELLFTSGDPVGGHLYITLCYYTVGS